MLEDLPPTATPISPDLLLYLQQLIDSNSEDNPRRLLAIAAFFEDEGPRFYGAPGFHITDLGYVYDRQTPQAPANLIRNDSAISVSYATAATGAATWMYIGGKHYTVSKNKLDDQ